MYSRVVDGQEYTFGVSGKLIMNALVMYDRQTGSLWSQILGEAIEGELQGARLEFVPAIHTTWADWKARHPDTLALVKGDGGDLSPYRRYFESDDAGVVGWTHPDDRLYVKEFVIGVAHEGEAVGYPFGVLDRQPVVNDEVGGEPVLVVFNPDTGAGAVFSRVTGDGRELTFTQQDGLALTDTETGSTWDGMAGVATEGPLAGTELRRMKSTAAFWFGWKDWYPETRAFGSE